MRLILPLCALLPLAACASRQAPTEEVPALGGVVDRDDVFYPDRERGGFTRGQSRADGYDLTVAIDSVGVSDDGLLYVAGTSGLVGGPRWVGIARFVRASERAPDLPGGNARPYGAEGGAPARRRHRPLALGAVAYVGAVVLDGRFELRAPLAEVADDTLGVFYEGGASWRRAVADLL